MRHRAVKSVVAVTQNISALVHVGKDHQRQGRVPSPIKTSNTLLVGLDGGNISTS